MAKLTEEMVVARTRASDLSTIKKLNCWGGELQDISLLRRMQNVEVLSLSVNKISSLADVQYCRNLRELYVRKNEIKNLNEICYLKSLPHLKALWLGENPCSVSDTLYRMTVIKNLPTLEKLDDVKIEPEERQDSLKRGRDLVHPEEDDLDNISPVQSPVKVARSPPVPSSGPSSDQDIEDSNDSRKSYSPDFDYAFAQPPLPPIESRYSQANDRCENKNFKSIRRPNEVTFEQPYDNEPGCEIEKQNDPLSVSFINRCNSDTSLVVKKEKSLTESNVKNINNTTNQEDLDKQMELKERYCNCASHHYERPIQVYACRSRERREGTRCSSSEGSGRTSPQKVVGERSYRQYDNHRIEGDRFSKSSPYSIRRPLTRNSNVLSAVLCLIKELDFSSLEVVSVAVRCRMDEIED